MRVDPHERDAPTRALQPGLGHAAIDVAARAGAATSSADRVAFALSVPHVVDTSTELAHRIHRSMTEDFESGCGTPTDRFTVS